MRPPSSLTARFACAGLAGACLAWAAAASAQVTEAPRPRRRPIPPPAAAPAPPPPGAPVAPSPFAPLGLGGFAGLPSPGDGGAMCRSACARTRYACEVQDQSCAAPWVACLKSCGVAPPSRSPALLSR